MGRVLAGADRFEAAVGRVAGVVRRAYPPLPPGARVWWASAFALASPMWVRVTRVLLIAAYLGLSYAPGPKALVVALAVSAGLVFLVLESRARRDLHREATRPGAELFFRPDQKPALSPRRAATTAAVGFVVAIGFALSLGATGVDEQLAVMLALGAWVGALIWIDRGSMRR